MVLLVRQFVVDAVVRSSDHPDGYREIAAVVGLRRSPPSPELPER